MVIELNLQISSELPSSQWWVLNRETLLFRSFIPFNSVWLFLVYKSYSALVTCIPKYFLFFDTIAMVLVSSCLFQMFIASIGSVFCEPQAAIWYLLVTQN